MNDLFFGDSSVTFVIIKIDDSVFKYKVDLSKLEQITEFSEFCQANEKQN